MRGIFTADREAVMQVEVRGPSGQSEIVPCVIDTGFTGYLTLPPDVVSQLGLAFHSQTQGTLADGSVITLAKYEATIVWDGDERPVMVLEASGGALLGVSTFYGERLVVDVVDGGEVFTIPVSS